MQIRLIDQQPFIVTANGKVVQTPAEARQTEQRFIDEGRAHIDQLDKAGSVIRNRLEAELIDGCDTAASRADIAAIEDEIHSIQRDVDSAGQRLKNIDLLIDQHAAAMIQKAADASLAALVAPFDSVLKELAQ